MPSYDLDAELADVLGDPVVIRLGGFDYRCKPDLPAALAFRLRTASADVAGITPEQIGGLFDAVLEDESAEHFAAEWEAERIGVVQVSAFLRHIMEGYAGRPTPGSIGSSGSAEPTGPPSTAGVRLVGSTPSA